VPIPAPPEAGRIVRDLTPLPSVDHAHNEYEVVVGMAAAGTGIFANDNAQDVANASDNAGSDDDDDDEFYQDANDISKALELILARKTSSGKQRRQEENEIQFL
jgi:hypothetical protein